MNLVSSEGQVLTSRGMEDFQYPTLIDAVHQYLMREVDESIRDHEAKKVQKKIDEEQQKKETGNREKEEIIDISSFSGSEEYFAAVSHQIPIAELYRLIDCCSNSEENQFCAILVQIENQELQKFYNGRYSLQVWTKTGRLIYSKTLQFPLHLWNLNGKYLMFVLSEKEMLEPEYLNFQKIFIVELSEDPKVPCQQAIISTLVFKFYNTDLATSKIELDTQLGFTDGYLIVTTNKWLKYVAINRSSFEPSKGEPTKCLQQLRYPSDLQYVKFYKDVRLLKIVEMQEGAPCLVAEQASGEISFLKLYFENNTLKLDELCDATTAKNQDHKDYVKKLRSVIFKCQDSGEYKQCGVALRNSGSVDFLWNFRCVDSYKVTDIVRDGIIVDIESDFNYQFYKKIEFQGSEALFKDLKDPTSDKYQQYNAAFLEDEQHQQLLYEMEIDQDPSEAQLKLIQRPSALHQLVKDEIKVKHVLKYCCNQWKERVGTNTSLAVTSDLEVMAKRLKEVQDQRVGNFAQIYPWFSNMQSHFCVAHAHFLSVFELSSQQWEHIDFLTDRHKPDRVIGGFRLFDKQTRDYWAGIVLESSRICFIRAYDMMPGLKINETDQGNFKRSGNARRGHAKQPLNMSPKDHIARRNQRDLMLNGECLKITSDKQNQRFVLFLVKTRPENQQNTDYTEGTLPPISPQKEFELCIFVTQKDESNCSNTKDSLHKIYTLPSDLLGHVLTEQTQINVIPQADQNIDEAYVVLDNPGLPSPQSHFFKLSNLQQKCKPKMDKIAHAGPIMHQKNLKDYRRPFNMSLSPEDAELQRQKNSMVGYIDQHCEDGSQANVIVTTSDVCIAKLIDHDQGEEKSRRFEVMYKYYYGRQIKAMIQLDSWMYTLSDPCEKLGKKDLEIPWNAAKKQNNDQKTLFFQENTVEEQASGVTVFSGVLKEAPGLYAYDLQRLTKTGDMITYKLKNAVVGVNRHIDFCNSSFRIAFLKDFDTIEMVPVPHRNTINFLGMQSKRNYLIWRENFGVLTALDKNGVLQSWVITTGKTKKPEVTQTNIDFKNYELYQCNLSDDTYMWNWQQHPDQTISLLKFSKRIDQYEPVQENIIAENQPAIFRDYRKEQSCPEVYLFKVLTMSDTIVKEEFSFTFDVRNKENQNEEEKQQLIFSRDLSKLMEVYSDSRCSIYTKRKGLSSKLRVEWVLTYQIKKFPTPLQGLSYANFLFSPNLNFFIDVAIRVKQFCIKSCKTNEVVLWIPKGLLTFKMNDKPEDNMKQVAGRIHFESENQIRIIDSYGLDSLMMLNIDQEGVIQDEKLPVIIRSVCKIDHFNVHECNKHFMKDQKFISFDRTLERLVRMNQRFKSKQYHFKSALEQREKWQKMVQERQKKNKKEYTNTKSDGIDDELDALEGTNEAIFSTVMHQQLQTVDYSQSWDEEDSQFVAEMCFTILDWQIIEKILEQNDTYVDSIEKDRLVQLCFNIFPKIKTVLHKFTEQMLEQLQMQDFLDKVNSSKLPDGTRVTIPILADIEGNTALDVTLTDATLSLNLASCILQGIQDYPFMHSGFVLVSAINKAFYRGVPSQKLGEYLDKRILPSGHLLVKGIMRAALKEEKLQYCSITKGDEEEEITYASMIGDVWQDKRKMKEIMYNKGEFSANLDICYFDIPQLHEFGTEGNKFFDVLANLDEDKIEYFGRKSIQILIEQKWSKIRPVMQYYLLIPHLGLLFSNLVWHTTVRIKRSEYCWQHRTFVVVQLIQVAYFVIIEIGQMIQRGLGNYLTEPQSYFNTLPMLSVIQSCTTSIIYDEPGPDEIIDQFNVIVDIIGTLLLWYGAFYYFRIWAEGGYLARMIKEVIIDMKLFFLIYMMYHLSFAQGFYFLSWANANPQYHFAPSLWRAFRYSFLAALGDFTYRPYFSGIENGVNANDNELAYIGWCMLTVCCIVSSIIMLNLLVAIISDRFVAVVEQKTLFMYQERAIAISQYHRILPKKFLTYLEMTEVEKILNCQKLLIIASALDETEHLHNGHDENHEHHGDVEFDQLFDNAKDMITELASVRSEVTQLQKRSKTPSTPELNADSLSVKRQETLKMQRAETLIQPLEIPKSPKFKQKTEEKQKGAFSNFKPKQDQLPKEKKHGTLQTEKKTEKKRQKH